MQPEQKEDSANNLNVRTSDNKHQRWEMLPRDHRPLHWWEIVAKCGSADLPFKRFYADALLEETVPQLSAAENERETMNLADPKTDPEQFLEPISTWSRDAVAEWGDESFSIEQWFDEGEELEFSDIEFIIEEPDRWERARQWMRSLVDAAGMRIS